MSQRVLCPIVRIHVSGQIFNRIELRQMKRGTGAAANALRRVHYIRAECKVSVWCTQCEDGLDRHFLRGAKADPVAAPNNDRGSRVNNRRKPRVLEERAHNLPGTLQLISREFAG